MPVYEYRCRGGHQYEKTEGFSAPSKQRCPTCNSMAKRMISLPAVIFKGSGFYHTDNRKESKSDNGSSSASTGTAGSKESSASSDGHSHDSGGGHSHPHGGDSAPKVEAAATD